MAIHPNLNLNVSILFGSLGTRSKYCNKAVTTMMTMIRLMAVKAGSSEALHPPTLTFPPTPPAAQPAAAAQQHSTKQHTAQSSTQQHTAHTAL